jgi:predicted phage tail protein
LPEWRKDNGEWVSVPRTGGLQVEVPGIYQGRYVARVRAQNVMNVTSLPAVSAETMLTGKTTPPPSVVSLKAHGVVFGINLEWAFPGDGSAGDTQRTELWYSRTASRDDAVKFSDFAYPQASTSYQGLAVGQVFYFWARLVDTTGNIGPWYPADGPGVQGQPTTDEDAYEDYFRNQIGKSSLGQDLLAPIESITPPMAGDAEEYAGDETQYAGVWSLQSAITEGDMAIAKRVDTVAAHLQSAAGTLTASVQTETQARVDADSAQAAQITTVEAKANENAAAVQTVAKSYADLNGRVSASYQIKTQITSDGRTYIAGIGIGIDNNDGIVESQVLVSASRFAVVDPNNGGAMIVPFVVQGGQVFIRQALIGAGWITNAMIGSYIQSDNYIAGRQGWRLDKSGWFEINASDGSGNRLVMDGSSVRVYDGNGVLRVRMGMW